MNIFALSRLVKECAEMHCDQHVIKMILESAQLLCTAHRVLDGFEKIVETGKMTSTGKMRKIKRWIHPDEEKETLLYKSCHVKHPCGVWVQASKENYDWLFNLFVELCKEYTFRYKKTHASESLTNVLSVSPLNIPTDVGLTEFAQAMPDDVKSVDSIEAYKNYYRVYKIHIKNGPLRWTGRNTPSFISDLV